MILMYNKDTLIGIVLGLSKLDFSISRDETRKIGYSIRLTLNFRAKPDCLLAIQRSLLQHQIESKFKSKEHSSRPKPILKITGNKNIIKITELLPDLPDAKGDLTKLKRIVELIKENKHTKAEGIEELFKIKGVI